MFLKSVRFIAPILIASILASCSASQHAGVANKQRPLLTETNEQVWFEYWADQFDANRGKVIAPPLEYPLVAKSAYGRAAQDWQMKVNEAATQTYIAWVSGVLGVSILLYVIAVSGAK